MKRRVWTHRAGKPSPDSGRESQVRFSGGHLKSFYRIRGRARSWCWVRERKMREQKEGTKGWESRLWAGNRQESRTIRTLNARLLAQPGRRVELRGVNQNRANQGLTMAWRRVTVHRYAFYVQWGLYIRTFQLQMCLWFQEGTRTCAIKFRSEWTVVCPSVSYCWQSFSSTISRHRSLLQTVALVACSLPASPLHAGSSTVLLFFPQYTTVRLKFFLFFYVLFV